MFFKRTAISGPTAFKQHHVIMNCNMQLQIHSLQKQTEQLRLYKQNTIFIFRLFVCSLFLSV